MNIYLVGGAVRDKLLGLEVNDQDWLVTGATPEYFLSKGYEQVGADFPVFLHPETKDEYALARTERKIGAGYNGFAATWEPGTLNMELLQKFLDNGFEIDREYSVEELMKALQHISQ